MSTPMPSTIDAQNQKIALGLALFGFVPFAALTLAMFLPNGAQILGLQMAALAPVALGAYAAIILSFLGGIRWGVAIANDPDEAISRTLVYSVAPSLWGWAAFFAPAPVNFLMFAIGFLAMGRWDLALVQEGAAPAWFGKLRLILTMLVVPTMLIASFGAMAS